MNEPVNSKLHRLIAKFQEYFDLKSDTDKVNTVKSVESGNPHEGCPNLWYLICSALLASNKV